MPRFFRYLTHPQVQIDPSVPVPEWGLSEIGRTRAKRFASLAILESTKVIVSSAETKAIETAKIISSVINVPIEIYEKTHENDRSATGFLEPKEFESVADSFFEYPDKSIRGWERAVDVQSRIVDEAAKIFETYQEGDILMIGHGAVGTLLYCHFAALEISRQYDQPGGGGNMFTVQMNTKSIVHPWASIERLTAENR